MTSRLAGLRLQAGRERTVPGSLRNLAASAPPWTAVAVVFAGTFITLSATQPQFLTYRNLADILGNNAVPMLLAVGTTFVLITGMIDLSVGSLTGLGSVIMLGLLAAGLPAALVIPLTIAACAALAGGFNGLLVAKFGLSFFIVGLGSMALFLAAAEIPTDAQPADITRFSGFPALREIGGGTAAGFPVPAVIALAGVLLAALTLRYLNFGRALYAIGGNATAARLAGIPVVRARMLAFAVNGAFAGAAALVLCGRDMTADPLGGTDTELTAVAAVLLGGTSFIGGSGSVSGTFVAVLFTGTLQNGFTLLGVAQFWQGAVTGGVLITAVALDRFRHRG